MSNNASATESTVPQKCIWSLAQFPINSNSKQGLKILFSNSTLFKTFQEPCNRYGRPNEENNNQENNANILEDKTAMTYFPLLANSIDFTAVVFDVPVVRRNEATTLRFLVLITRI